MDKILKKLSYSFMANIFSALTSVLMILVLPKVMSMEAYGIWQLFIFYFTYVGFFHFGWTDGIYLRYGGAYYDKLDRKVFSGQFWLLCLFVVIECLLANIFLVYGFVEDDILFLIFKVASISGVFLILLSFANFVLQLTNRIKEYARNILLERFTLLALIIACVVAGKVQYEEIIYTNLISNFLVMCIALYVIRDLIFTKTDNITNALKEAGKNISAGSKLMLSNIAGMLILGIIRFGISQGWDIVTFGKVSLTLSISNFLMVFISAVSVVLFPILKRINQDRLAEIYLVLRRVSSYSLLGLLITYYPLNFILIQWLPKYSDSLFYMGMLLPICVFESKMQMVVNTYLKSLRQEALMLKINIIAVIFAFITTYATVVVLHNLQFAILAIVVNFAFRLLIAEYFVEKLLSLNLRRDSLEELLVVVAFIAINLLDNNYNSLIYLFIYLYYTYMNKENIKETLKKIRYEFTK